MTKVKYLILSLAIGVLLFFIPNIVNAAEVEVTRNLNLSTYSMKFSFTGLTLDKNHEYEYGLTKTSDAKVEKWFLLKEYTSSTTTVDLDISNRYIKSVIDFVDTGYITIKDKTTNEIVLQPYNIDLKFPFLNVTNYSVLPNGSESQIIPYLRDAYNCKAYYQYEKITDETVIKKYNEIKNENGDYNQLQSLLKTTSPNSNWTLWKYFYGSGLGGQPQKSISVPDTGLYYMWLYFSGPDVKDIYGYILIDNLQPDDIVLESISLPKTKEVSLDTPLTLNPIFTPETTTHKIVTWKSSDESVATIDNGGKITPKKVGSTIITVTSQDGNKSASCTVTVVNSSNNNENSKDENKQGILSSNNDKASNNKNNTAESSNTTNTNNGISKSNSSTSVTSNIKSDTSLASGNLPKTGVGIGLSLSIITCIVLFVLVYIKCRYYKGI